MRFDAVAPPAEVTVKVTRQRPARTPRILLPETRQILRDDDETLAETVNPVPVVILAADAALRSNTDDEREIVGDPEIFTVNHRDVDGPVRGVTLTRTRHRPGATPVNRVPDTRHTERDARATTPDTFAPRGTVISDFLATEDNVL